MKFLSIFGILFPLLFSSCASSIVTRHVPATPGPVSDTEGIHYFLPKTLIRVNVPVAKTSKSPGPYAELAPFFFPGADQTTIIKVESVSYTIDAAAVSIATRGVKDISQQYVLRPTGQLFADTKFHFVMNDQGVPGKISAEIDNKSFDVALTLLESAASLTGKALTGGALASLDVAPPDEEKKAPEKKAQCEELTGELERKLTPRVKLLFCNLSPDDRAAVFGEEPSYAIVLANYLDSELKNNPASLRTAAVQAKIARFLGARAYFAELVALQNAGATILTRDPAQTLDSTFKALFDSRLARMKELTDTFFGTTRKNPTYWTAAYDADLAAADANAPLLLFTMRQDKGICSINETSSLRLVTARAELAGCGGEVRHVLFMVNSAETVITAMAPDHSAESGLRYRIPRAAVVRLYDDNSEFSRQNVTIAQFGQIASLPRKVGGMKTQYDVIFDGATGALLDITVGNSALIDSSAVKRVAGLADTGIGLKQKLDETPAAETAQQKAEKERKLKAEQLKIVLIQACLAEPAKPGCIDLVKLQ